MRRHHDRTASRWLQVPGFVVLVVAVFGLMLTATSQTLPQFLSHL